MQYLVLDGLIERGTDDCHRIILSGREIKIIHLVRNSPFDLESCREWHELLYILLSGR